jgi:hypothetical protein
MTERSLLEIGIRALGLFFVFIGLSALFAAVARDQFNSQQIMLRSFASVSFVTPVVGALLIRFGKILALRLAEEPSIEEQPSSMPKRWERWLFTTAVVYAIVIGWEREFLPLLQMLIYSTASSAQESRGPLFVLVVAILSLAVTSAIGLAVIKNLALLHGKTRND